MVVLAKLFFCIYHLVWVRRGMRYAPFRDIDSLGPEYCSGAVLSLFWPLFGPQRTQILFNDPEYDPSLLGVAFEGHLGAILGQYKRKK